MRIIPGIVHVLDGDIQSLAHRSKAYLVLRSG